jgi:hypothetical protein
VEAACEMLVELGCGAGGEARADAVVREGRIQIWPPDAAPAR